MTEQPQVRLSRPAPDPWKSFRGVMAGTLILEAIVVLLALPVVGAVGGGLTAVVDGLPDRCRGVLVLLAGVQGRPWAIWANLGVQLVLIAGWVVYPGVGFIGRAVRGRLAADRLPARPRCCAGSGAGCCRASSGRRLSLMAGSSARRSSPLDCPVRCAP